MWTLVIDNKSIEVSIIVLFSHDETVNIASQRRYIEFNTAEKGSEGGVRPKSHNLHTISQTLLLLIYFLLICFIS